MNAAIVLLVMPWALGLYGAALVLNLFGVTTAEARFYHGRGAWYPILDGANRGTHRLAGLFLVIFAGLTTLMMWSSGVL